MSVLARLFGTSLERVIDETVNPSTPHMDALFEANIRKVFKGFYKASTDTGWALRPRAICIVRGRNLFIRPSDPTRFLFDCKRYGLENHPAVIELDRRFSTDRSFFLEFRNEDTTVRHRNRTKPGVGVG